MERPKVGGAVEGGNTKPIHPLINASLGKLCKSLGPHFLSLFFSGTLSYSFLLLCHDKEIPSSGKRQNWPEGLDKGELDDGSSIILETHNTYDPMLLKVKSNLTKRIHACTLNSDIRT